MENTTPQHKTKIGFMVIWQLLVCSMFRMGCEGIVGIVGAYYVLFQDAYQLTATQMGILQTINGAMALVSTFCGGFLADRFNPRKLIMTAAVISIAAGAFYYTLPTYNVLMVAYAVICFAATLPYYSALPKYMASFVDRKSHGKLWGLYSALGSIFGFLSGIITSAITAAGTAVGGIRGLLILFMGLGIFSFIALMFLGKQDTYVKPEKVEGKKKSGGLDRKTILALIREPDLWLITICCTCLWECYVATTYMTSMLKNVYQVSTASTTMISTIGNYGFRMVGGLFFGAMIDKLTAHRVIKYIHVIFSVLMIICIIMPATQINASVSALAITMSLLTLLFFRIGGQSMNPALSQCEYHIPYTVRGMAYSILATVQNIPGLFIYIVCGKWIDNYGVKGYHMIFIYVLILQIIGFICIVAIKKRQNKPGTITGKTVSDFDPDTYYAQNA